MSTDEQNWKKLWERLDKTDSNICDLGRKINSLDTKFSQGLAQLEEKHDKDIKNIKEDIEKVKSDINTALAASNDVEQYNRSWCIRIFGISVPEDLEKEVGHVKATLQTVWDRVVGPILQEIVEKETGDLEEVPNLVNVLENGHRLGRVVPDLPPPPIIVRFTRRDLRDLVIKNRKLAPKLSEEEVNAGFKFGIVEDLTSSNYKHLKALIDDPRVDKVWTIRGKFKVILRDDTKKKIFNCPGYVNVDELVKKIGQN